jgi:hypothetical protein
MAGWPACRCGIWRRAGGPLPPSLWCCQPAAVAASPGTSATSTHLQGATPWVLLGLWGWTVGLGLWGWARGAGPPPTSPWTPAWASALTSSRPRPAAAEQAEAEAFWCFVALMERLEGNFHHDQRGMHAQLCALRKLLQVRALGRGGVQAAPGKSGGSLAAGPAWLLWRVAGAEAALGLQLVLLLPGAAPGRRVRTPSAGEPGRLAAAGSCTPQPRPSPPLRLSCAVPPAGPLQVLDPQLHAYFEARDCLNYFFCFRWVLIHFKREFSFEQVGPSWAGRGGQPAQGAALALASLCPC